MSKCGHLYCWSCIYTWMSQPRDVMVCPVCKSGISKESVIPIYTKESNDDPRQKKQSGQEEQIPGRPQGARSEPEPNPNGGAHHNFNNYFAGFPGFGAAEGAAG